MADKVGQLTVFQRRPNWCAPLHNGTISAEEMAEIRADYDEIFESCDKTPGGFIHDRIGAVGRGDARGTPGLLGEALRRTRLRHLAGQLPRRADRRGRQRRVLGLRRRQDPRARQGPGAGREADPQGPRLRHPARADGDALLRGLQPSNVHLVSIGETPIERITPTGIRTSEPTTSSTSSSTPPASTPSPAPSTASTSSAPMASACATAGTTGR